MNGDQILNQLLNYLPVVLSVLIALGLYKALGNLIRLATGKARAAAASTKTPLDDAIVGPIADKLDAFAADLEDGKLDGKAAAARLRLIKSSVLAKK
jgi:hypothetical protein